MSRTKRLFVYGTLAPGRVNHHVVENIDGVWESATLRGELIEAGWGAAMGCPGIIPSASGDIVEGHLLTSQHLPAHWARLDAFEGAAYERVSVEVTVNGSDRVRAFVYALRRHD